MLKFEPTNTAVADLVSSIISDRDILKKIGLEEAEKLRAVVVKHFYTVMPRNILPVNWGSKNILDIRILKLYTGSYNKVRYLIHLNFELIYRGLQKMLMEQVSDTINTAVDEAVSAHLEAAFDNIRVRLLNHIISSLKIDIASNISVELDSIVSWEGVKRIITHVSGEAMRRFFL